MPSLINSTMSMHDVICKFRQVRQHYDLSMDDRENVHNTRSFYQVFREEHQNDAESYI